MVIEVYNIKKKEYNIRDYLEFKHVAKAFSSRINYIQTGQSKTMFYIKVVGKESTWKQILNNGVRFDYIPSGNVKNVKWNNVKVKI